MFITNKDYFLFFQDPPPEGLLQPEGYIDEPNELQERIKNLRDNIDFELNNLYPDLDYINECINIIKKTISEIIKLK